jgi:transposase-like protein
MIISVSVEHGPKCGSTNIIRNGHDDKGAQKYSSHACGA